MNFNEVIRYCLRCGHHPFTEKSPFFFQCEQCGYAFHINTATAVAGIVTDETKRVLVIRRGKDPGKGKLSIPGGFVDAGESAEAALKREMKEEVDLEVTHSRYLASFPNPYEYRGIVYPVLDMVFACKTRSLEAVNPSEEVEGHHLLRPDEIDLREMAFPSIRKAMEIYLSSSGV